MTSTIHPVLDPVALPESLAPAITAAAAEADRLGAIPDDLRSRLRAAGAFRLLTPRELGGWEAPLPTVLEIYERFGYLDASVGLLVWNANFGFVGAMLEPAGAAQIWADGVEPVFANSGQPGTAVPVDGGHLLTGEWKIVTGIKGADWVVLVGLAPEPRLFVLHVDQVTVRDTWDVTAMRATGSHHVSADAVFVPAALSVALDSPPRIDRPLYRGFLPTLVFPGCSAVALGITRRAVDEVVALVGSKPTMTGGTAAEVGRIQLTIARSEAAVTAAWLLLKHAADELSTAGAEVTVQQRAALRAAMSYAAEVCRHTLSAVHEIAGSAALYRSEPIERVLRDGMSALQHANHSATFLEAAGRVRLGLEPGLPLF
jgi:indole-3-acetate monooxygenase